MPSPSSSPTPIIRDAREEDIPAISRLYYETVHRVNAQHYSPAQISAWAPDVEPDEFWQQRWVDCEVLVAQCAREVVGFAEYTPRGHIDCFYVHHAWQRQGIGRGLFEWILGRARDRGLPRLDAEVSITALPFFQAQGLVVTATRTTSYRGETFLIYLMERLLSSA